MHIACPKCGKLIEIDERQSSSNFECPRCEEVFSVDIADTIASGLPAAESSSTIPRDGQKLSRFRLLDRIGRTPFSEVWRARDEFLQRMVAIKLSEGIGADETRLAHLKSEALSAAKLNHPGIATLYDVGIENGQLFIVQQLVDGQGIDQWCREKRPSYDVIARVSAAVARALAHAHDQGIHHRDIKPSNIVVDPNGQPHIVDFGLASPLKIVGDQEFSEGIIVGTPAYMSPEQARGERSDQRSDIYSLGGVLYQMLTGRRPFSGDNVHRVMDQVQHETPTKPASLDVAIPSELERICLKCLAKQPRERYSSASLLAIELEQFADEFEQRSPREPSRIASERVLPRAELESRTAYSALITELSTEVERLSRLNENLQDQAAERNQMLLAVKTEHDLYRSLVESLPLCVFRKDSSGRFVFTNEYFAATLGQAIGKTAEGVFGLGLASQQDSDDELVKSAGAVRRTVEEHVGIDGQVKSFEVLKSPVHNLKGEIVGVQGLMWDVSAHTRMEKALRQAKEAAEEANRSKSDFLANMSHELRTPLNGILGHLSILDQDETVVSRRQANLGAIKNCANHLLAVINEILDLSKIESGRLQIERKPTDLHHLLRGVDDIVRVRAENQGLKFSVDSAIDLPKWVLMDGKRLAQILINLISNAVKFTAQGSVTLRVAVISGNCLSLEVEDTGVGIPESKYADILRPFVQLPSNQVLGGTGLGLAITKHLVESLDGQLRVESVVGEGSTFRVELPIQEAIPKTAEEFATFDNQLPTDHFRLADGQTWKILIVDDVATNRDVLSQNLTIAGFQTFEACDGQHALEMLGRHEPHVVLMDIRMPKMDGLEAIKAIRADPILKHTKVIAVTASVFREDQEKVIKAGFDDFLGKPVSLVELFSQLAQHLGVNYRPAPHNEDAKSSALPTVQEINQLCARIEEAVATGDIEELRQIGEQLATRNPDRSIGRQMLKFVAAFDLTSVSELAKQLKQSFDTEN